MSTFPSRALCVCLFVLGSSTHVMRRGAIIRSSGDIVIMQGSNCRNSTSRTTCNLNFSQFLNSPFTDNIATFQTTPPGLKLKFGEVCMSRNRKIDLVVKSLSDYSSQFAHNKVIGNMFQLNLRSGTQANFSFELVSGETEEPVTVDELIFSVLDLGGSGKVQKRITCPGISSVAGGTGVCQLQPSVFQSWHDGAVSAPKQTGWDYALSIRYEKVTSWNVEFATVGGVTEGENFFLAGASALMPANTMCSRDSETDQLAPCPERPILSPTASPTPVPTPVPTAVPTQVPTALPTTMTTASPTVDPNGKIVAPGTIFAVGQYRHRLFAGRHPMFHSTPQPVAEGMQGMGAGDRHVVFLATNNSAQIVTSYLKVKYGQTKYEGEDRFETVQVGKVTAVDAAGDVSFLVLEDHRLFSIAAKTHSYEDRDVDTTPVHITDDVKAVSTCGHHTFILKNNGHVYSFGKNTEAGVLGDGTRQDRLEPVFIMSGAKQVLARKKQSLILGQDGTVYVTGCPADKSYGVCRDIKEATRPTALKSGIKAMATGNVHTLLVTETGTLLGIGNNQQGQLGITSSDQKEYHQFVEIAHGVQSVAAMGYTSFYLTSAGEVYGMGQNRKYRLGDGTKQSHVWSPKKLMTGVRKIVASAGEDSYAMFLT